MEEPPGLAVQRFARTVLRHRRAILVGVLLATAAAFPGSLRVERDDSVRAWFEADSPAIQRYDRFEALFGSDEFVVVALPVEDPFAPALLTVLQGLTRDIEEQPEVDRAWSLDNLEAVAAEPDGSVFVGELFRDIPPDPAEVARARARLRDDPLLRTRVVSADESAVAVVARLRPGLDEHSRHHAAQAIRALAERYTGRAPFMAGQAVLDEAFFRVSQQDIDRLFPLMLVVMAGVLAWIFRSVAAVLLPLVAVGIAVTLVLSTLAATGRTDNILMGLLPLILLIVGVFGSIHLMLETRRAALDGAPPREATERGMARVLVPTVAAQLTTAAGFASFLTSRSPPVQTFGGLAAFGIALSCVLSLTFLPACLSFFSLGRARSVPLAGRRLWLGLAGASGRHANAVLGVGSLLALLAALLLPRIDRTENWLEYFPAEHAIPTASAFIEEHFFGMATLEVVLSGPRSVLLDPTVLRRVQSFAERLAREPEVERTIALPDLLEQLHRALHGGDEAAAGLPDDTAAVEQYLLLLRKPGGDVERFLAAGETATRVSARVRLGDAETFGQLVALAEREARDVDPRLETFVTGVTDLNFRNGENIVSLQLTSLAVAFPVVTLVAGAALRSVRLMPAVAITSVLPVLGCLGIMALLGIPLTAGSALVGSVALGFVVDDAVFLLARLRASGWDELPRVLCDVGPGLAHTSLVVCAGFAVLGLSRFTPNAHFGLLTCLALSLAFLANVVVLPSLVQLFLRKR